MLTILKGFMGFFDEFCRDSMGFPAFYRILLRFFEIFRDSWRFFVEFCRNLMRFSAFYGFSQHFAGFF